MHELTILITMAGRNRRFNDAGYALPKYMLDAHGKTIFEYSLGSLPLEMATQIIFVGLTDHESKFSLTKFIEHKLPACMPQKREVNSKVLLLDTVTNGQAETAYAARNIIDPNEGMLIYNIDTCFESPTLQVRLEKGDFDGLLGAFTIEGDDPKWSFAKVDSEGRVVETAEKVQISQFALTGLYHFSRAGDFFKTAREVIDSGKKDKGEFYIAPLYNDLIRAGRRIVLDVAAKVIPLGTPEDYEAFKKCKK